jgi:hypothetical protein
MAVATLQLEQGRATAVPAIVTLETILKTAEKTALF